MKFFVPNFRGEREMSESVWLTFRAQLRENGMPTTRRRIAALVVEIDGADHYIAVDHEEAFGGEIAMLILESEDRERVHICTLKRGLGDAPPWTLPLESIGGWWILNSEPPMSSAPTRSEQRRRSPAGRARRPERREPGRRHGTALPRWLFCSSEPAQAKTGFVPRAVVAGRWLLLSGVVGLLKATSLLRPFTPFVFAID